MLLTILRIGILENDDWLVSGFLLTSYRQSHQTGVIALVGRELCGDWAEQPLHIASNSFFVESTLTFPKKWDRMKFTRSGWPAEKSTKLRRYIPEEASVKSTQQESTFSESKDYIDYALYAKVGVLVFFQLRRSGCTHSMNNVVGCSGFESTTRVRSRSRPMMIK